MHSLQQKELLRILRPVLKDQTKAKIILERYFLDRLALIWTIHDVFRAGNEIEMVLTRAEARSVLLELEHGHNKQLGLRWSDVTDLIQAKVLGREITKKELTLFVQKDIIAIQHHR